MLYQREDTPIWLTRPELEALEEAMSSFVQLVREMIPASNSRDETLREIEGFRDTLKMMLSRSQC
jgi:hypothetical protein